MNTYISKLRDLDVIQFVKVEDILPAPHQPRRFIDPHSLKELENSIKKVGILSPLLLRPGDNGKYVLVAGQRRLLAARNAGVEKVPAVIRDFDSDSISLIENIQRQNLNPVEEAEAYLRLQKAGYSCKEIGLMIGKSKSYISRMAKIARLPEKIKQEIIKNGVKTKEVLVEIARSKKAKSLLKHKKLTVKHVRALAGKKTDVSLSNYQGYVYTYTPLDNSFKLVIYFKQSKVKKDKVIEALKMAQKHLYR